MQRGTFVLILSVLWAQTALCEVYRYVDAAGSVHLSDYPKNNNYQEVTLSSAKDTLAKDTFSLTRMEQKPISQKPISIDRPQPVAYPPARAGKNVSSPTRVASKPIAVDRPRRPPPARASDTIDHMIEREATAQGISPALVKAVVHAESSFHPHAVSPKGAMGLMQLMPKTALDLGVKNPFDPQENIRGGIHYLRKLLREFNNNITLSLAAYNAGAQQVLTHNGIPPFQETRRYVKKVHQLYQMYSQRAMPSIFKIVRVSGEEVYTNRLTSSDIAAARSRPF